MIAHYAIDYINKPKTTSYWRNQILKVVQLFTGQYSFPIASKDQNELNEYGYNHTGDWPVVLARDERNHKFIMTDEFS